MARSPLPATELLPWIWRLVGPCFPKGAAIAEPGEAAHVPPWCRYWARLRPDSAPIELFPEDARLSAPVLRRIFGWSESDPAWDAYRRLFAAGPDGRQFVPVAVRIPQDARWPIVGTRAESGAVIWWLGDLKSLFFHLDRNEARVIALTKRPLTKPLLGNCRNEYAVLIRFARQRLDVAPRPIAHGRLACAASESSRHFFTQEYLPLPAAPPLSPETVAAFLARLRLAGRTVSPAAIAARLSRRIAALEAPAESKAALAALLAGVTDRREYPASIVHGDLRPHNLLAGGGRLVAIDWELASRDGLGFLDFLWWSLSPNWLQPQAKTWPDLIPADRLGFLDRWRGQFFPDGAPPLGQLLSVHVVQGYVGCVSAFGIVGPNITKLDALIRTPWPFAHL